MICISDFPDVIEITSREAANRELPELMGRYQLQRDMVHGLPYYRKIGGTHLIFSNCKFSGKNNLGGSVCNYEYKSGF